MSKIDRDEIYAAVRAIPVGTVITYGDLAESVGLSRDHARAVGSVLRNRPDNDAWMTMRAEDHDIPWWRVVKSDGTMLTEEDEQSRRWVAWATKVLLAEGVEFTADGRVARLAAAHRHRSGASRASRSKPLREPEPCWRHETVQYSCRDCAPSR